MGIHHAIVFVHDMERSLRLFQEIIGFKLVWRVPEIGDDKLSSILGMENMKAEIAYLVAGPENTAVELVRLKNADPGSIKETVCSNGIGLSLTVQDVDNIHEQLQDLGWSPFTDPMDMMGPNGKVIRMFCFRTEEQLLIEIVQRPS